MKKWKLSKNRVSHAAIALTSISCIGVSSTLTSCGLTEEQIKNSVLPTVKVFTDYSYRTHIINNKTSIAVNLAEIPNDSTPEYPNPGSRRQMIREIFQNICGEFYAKLQGTKHSLVSHPQFKTHIENNPHEISFIFINGDHLDGFSSVTKDRYPEAYQIDIGDAIQVKAFNEMGWISAAKTLLQLQTTNPNGIPCGKISDWPKIKQRGIEVDFSGRGYSLDFVKSLIQSMSWNKLNTLALRFASGGMRLDCKKLDEAPKDNDGNPTVTDGTWFNFKWSDFEQGASDDVVYLNLNDNYRDSSPTWDWREGNNKPDTGFSDFGNILNLAFKEGVNIIPEMNIFTHAWFLTDLTRPYLMFEGKKVYYPDDGEGVKDSYMKEHDFAIWDDRVDDVKYPLGKRIPDSLDLRGEKIGSKAAIAICERLITYLAKRFKSVGNWNKHALLSFGIGGDEYIETLDNSWNGDVNTWSDKGKIINSIYTFSNQMYKILNDNGIIDINQWSDSLLKKYAEGPSNVWPVATTDEWNEIYAYKDNLTIKHWWSKYGNASIEEFVKPYASGQIGGGIKNIVNYNSDQLYFSDDESNTSTAPTAKYIFDNFQPGIFAGDAGVYLDNNGENHDEYPEWLKGAMMSVWWDWSPHVATMIDGPLKAFAQKCWNGTDNAISFEEFSKLTNKLGRAPLIDWN